MATGIEVIKFTMTDEKMKRFATDIARESVTKWGVDANTSRNIGQNLRKAFPGKWNCFVGSMSFLRMSVKRI